MMATRTVAGRRRPLLPFGFAVLLSLGLAIEARAAEPGLSAEIVLPIKGSDAVEVSPTGLWLAARATAAGRTGVLVQRVGVPKMVLVGQFWRIVGLAWDGPDQLLIQHWLDSSRIAVQVVNLQLEAEEIRFESFRLPPYGTLVDATPLHPGHVVWDLEFAGRDSLHQVTLEQIRDWKPTTSIRTRSSRTLGTLLAVVDGSVHRWILDRSGRPRAALRRDEGGYSILSNEKSGGRFEVVHSFLDDENAKRMFPLGLSPNDRYLFVAKPDEHGFVGLYEFDIAGGAIGRSIFRPREADVTEILIDSISRELIGARYTVAGEARTHYFDAYRDDFLSKIPDEWDRTTLSIVSSSEDRERFVFLESNATNPGEYHFRNSDGRISSIAEVAQDLDRGDLSSVSSIKVRSKDGLEVEAFLTIPRKREGRAPLVVMPHGGPIGVHDTREFNPEVQYYASWGFAVLQVNYRGSSGYGTEFMERGHKQWAEGIEDDIDAAVEHVMRRPEIDDERICIIGGSYGGFSALASAIRHEDRYRCAVTINGVTDVPLLADSGDNADSRRALSQLEEIIGDFETEREKLLAISPVYHAKKIQVPVLVIQGNADTRVDPEHAHRLVAMLKLYEKEHETLFMEGAEHSFDRAEWIKVVRRVRKFLTDQLQPGIMYRYDPESNHKGDRTSASPEA